MRWDFEVKKTAKKGGTSCPNLKSDPDTIFGEFFSKTPKLNKS